MSTDALRHLLETLTQSARPLNSSNKYAELLNNIGNARFVLIGEATHGTHEFYQTRMEITQALIEQKGFKGIAIEGDWPDAYRIHHYLQGSGTIEDALSGFKRFPTWMWRNTDMPPFLKWLRAYNDKLDNMIGFYGLDLYSMYASMHAVVAYLEKVDPEAAKKAKERYGCFDHVRADPQFYGYLTTMGLKKACIDEAVSQLLELQLNRFNDVMPDAHFFATQNARVVKDAEKYYRSMFEGESSWNIRDKHMAETLNVIAEHLEDRDSEPAKIVVWAHNSHVGDARATEMSERGELNLGQLMREQYGTETYLIGFSTYDGFVTAASSWDAPAEHKVVKPGLAGSYEELFHQVKHKNFILNLHEPKLQHYLQLSRLQRAIGVIYKPQSERESHYFFTRLLEQFDSLIHLDRTTALEPLDVDGVWHREKKVEVVE